MHSFVINTDCSRETDWKELEPSKAWKRVAKISSCTTTQNDLRGVFYTYYEPSRNLRSTSHNSQPSANCLSSRAFKHSASAFWNSLLVDICCTDSLNGFLPRNAMHSTDYAVARCPSVRLSHAGIVSNGQTYHQTFSPSGIHGILVFFPYRTLWQCSNGDLPNCGVECRKKQGKHLPFISQTVTSVEPPCVCRFDTISRSSVVERKRRWEDNSPTDGTRRRQRNGGVSSVFSRDRHAGRLRRCVDWAMRHRIHLTSTRAVQAPSSYWVHVPNGIRTNAGFR